MTTAGRTARTARTSHYATSRAAWLFPGATKLELAVNCYQFTMEETLHNLEIARGLEYIKDLTQIAELRLLSAQCSMALERCRMEPGAA
jgi:hypothetical protein